MLSIPKLLSDKSALTKMVTFFFTALILLFTGLLLLAIYLNAPAIVFKDYGNLSWIFIIHIVNSVIVFILYGYDKFTARRDKQRIREIVLHFSEFLGGWPGGLLARPIWKHKTDWKEKFAFKITNWLIIFVHLSFWIWYFFLK